MLTSSLKQNVTHTHALRVDTFLSTAFLFRSADQQQAEEEAVFCYISSASKSPIFMSDSSPPNPSLSVKRAVENRTKGRNSKWPIVASPAQGRCVWAGRHLTPGFGLGQDCQQRINEHASSHSLGHTKT